MRALCVVERDGVEFASVVAVAAARHAIGQAPVVREQRLADDHVAPLRALVETQGTGGAGEHATGMPVVFLLAEVAPAGVKVHPRCAQVEEAVLDACRRDRLARACLEATLAAHAQRQQPRVVLAARRAQHIVGRQTGGKCAQPERACHAGKANNGVSPGHALLFFIHTS